jgi:hypothetical protein
MRSLNTKSALAFIICAMAAPSAFAEKTPPPPPANFQVGPNTPNSGCTEWKIRQTLDKLLKNGAIKSDKDAEALAKIVVGSIEKKKEIPPTIPVTQKPKSLQELGVQKPQVDYMGELQAKLKKRQQGN